MDARDGILIADQARTGARNQRRIWRLRAARSRIRRVRSTARDDGQRVVRAAALVREEGQAAFSQKSYAEDGTIVSISVGDDLDSRRST
jgi:hypothetical protein